MFLYISFGLSKPHHGFRCPNEKNKIKLYLWPLRLMTELKWGCPAHRRKGHTGWYNWPIILPWHLCPADSETVGMTPSQDIPEVDKCSRPHRWTQHIEAQDWMCSGVLDKGQKAWRAGQTPGSNHSTLPQRPSFQSWEKVPVCSKCQQQWERESRR